MPVKKAAPGESGRGSSYRWIILAVAFFVQVFCSMALYGLSPLGPYIRQDLAMSNTQYGLLFTVSNFGTMLMVTFAGGLVDKKGARIMMLAGQLVMGFALLAAAAAGTLRQFSCILFAVGVCQSVAGPTGAKAVLLWFEPSERATAMGIKQAGIPAAGIIAGVILPPIASAAGWRGALSLVGVLLILAAVLSFILYHDPSCAQQPARAPAKRKGTWRETLSRVLTRDIVILSLGCGILMGVQFAFTSYLVSYLGDVLAVLGADAPVILAGTMYSLTSAGGFAGRLGLGLISDKLFRGKRKGTMVAVNIIGTAVLLLTAAAMPNMSIILIAATVFLYGLTGVSFTGLQLSMVSELADIDASGSATGFTLALGFVGMMTVPAAFGSVADRTGSYFWAWLLLFGLSAMGTLLLLFVREKKRAA